MGWTAGLGLRLWCRMALGLAVAWVSVGGVAGCAGVRSGGADVPPDAAAPQGLAYLWQSVQGHLQVLQAARPVADWLADPSTPADTHTQLERAQAMRRFAVQQLALPDNASYTRYADLKRAAVVWNVVATPADSLRLKTWCFPVMGCVGYRGYFQRAHAQALADALARQGWDAMVYPVPAYSTLGWTNWLGGDPLLNTMLAYPQGELARLLFHELAHQRVYAADDTAFNESYATAVERLGGRLWLSQSSSQVQAAFAQFDARRTAFRALTRDVRKNLEEIYAPSHDRKAFSATENNNNSEANSSSMLVKKAGVLADFRERYKHWRDQWGGYSGYDAWVAQANNAAFAVQAAYDQWVPAFEAMFAQQGRDFARFHAEVERLAALPVTERTQALQGWMAQAATLQPEAPGQPSPVQKPIRP